MADFAEKLGLGFLFQEEELTRRVIGHVVGNGKMVTGYYGSPYFDETFGDAEIVARVIKRRDGKLELSDIDTHSVGRCVWNVRSLGMNIDRKDADILEKRCVVCNADDGSGMAVINILRADVLPCFAEGEEMKLQVIAFPSQIEYFESKDAYEASVPADKNERKWMLEDGTIVPTGLLRNRNPDGEHFEQDEMLDDLMLLRGTVKRFYYGKCRIGKEEWNGYIRCIIDTQFGELEIVHTIDDVPEEQRKNLSEGATVTGVVTLSGDAAIYEYGSGAIYDEAHDLSLLRSVILGGDAERLRGALTDDVVYHSEYSGLTYTGADKVLEQLRTVQKEAGVQYFVHYAVLSSVEKRAVPLPYGEGKQCLVLASEQPEQYESIAFIELAEEGKIRKLTTSTNGKYHFRLKTFPKPKDILEDVKIPERVEEPMLLRAKLLGVVENDTAIGDLLKDEKERAAFDDIAKKMMAGMVDGDETERLTNLLGYLFAKALEAEILKKQKSKDTVIYVPEDAWTGELYTMLPMELHAKVQDAVKFGRQFYRDFSFFHPAGKEKNQAFVMDLQNALILTQQFGKRYISLI